MFEKCKIEPKVIGASKSFTTEGKIIDMLVTIEAAKIEEKKELNFLLHGLTALYLCGMLDGPRPESWKDWGNYITLAIKAEFIVSGDIEGKIKEIETCFDRLRYTVTSEHEIPYASSNYFSSTEAMAVLKASKFVFQQKCIPIFCYFVTKQNYWGERVKLLDSSLIKADISLLPLRDVVGFIERDDGCL